MAFSAVVTFCLLHTVSFVYSVFPYQENKVTQPSTIYQLFKMPIALEEVGPLISDETRPDNWIAPKPGLPLSPNPPLRCSSSSPWPLLCSSFVTLERNFSRALSAEAMSCQLNPCFFSEVLRVYPSSFSTACGKAPTALDWYSGVTSLYRI